MNLIESIKRDDAKTILKLIKKGLDPNEKLTGYNTTPLVKASDENRFNAVVALVDAGADINKPVSRGVLPLHQALSKGHEKIANFLMQRGADPFLLGEYGQSALDFACRGGLANIVKTLLDLGAVKNYSIEHLTNALHIAAGASSSDSVRYLLEAGADPHKRTHDKNNAFWIALLNPNEKVFHEVMRVRNAQSLESIAGVSPFHSLMFQCISNIQLYIDRTGMKVNDMVDGQSLWTCSLEHASPAHLQALIENYEVDVTQTKTNGFSLCHYAAKNNTLDLFKFAVEKGCLPLQATSEGIMPFQQVIGAPGRQDFWAFLLDNGLVRINPTDMVDQPLNWRVYGNGPHWYFTLGKEGFSLKNSTLSYEATSLSPNTMVHDGADGLEIFGFWGGQSGVYLEKPLITRYFEKNRHFEPDWCLSYGGEGYNDGVIAKGKGWESLRGYLGYP